MAGTVDYRVDAPAASGTAAEPLLLELQVQDPETIAALAAYAEGSVREQFALAALRIGVLALRQAQGQLDSTMVQRECERMLGDMQRQLSDHSRQVNDRLASALKEYFDPQTGRFQERVNSLVKRDGELEQVLRRQIGSQDSELCKTLVNHVGEQSPLMKILSPKQSEGLLAHLSETMAAQLEVQRETVLKQFSLDNKEGALARLLQELTASHGQLNEKLQGKIDGVMKEFSLNEENSALSRLVRNVTAAQAMISKEFSLDNDASAFSRLKKILESHEETNQKFQEEVKLALATMAAKRAEAERSTRHGVEFETVVGEFLTQLTQQAGDVAAATGNTTGQIKNCKVGDYTITLGPESAAPDAVIVLEAKEVQGYDLAQARLEIDTARKNRAAQVGLFVFSKKCAPAGLEPLARYGSDVIVIWDAEDAASDLFLKTGVSLAKALCVRAASQREAQAADFSAIDAAILEISKRSADLDKINGWTETIRSNGQKIMDHIRIARAALDRQVSALEEHLSDLKQTLHAPNDGHGAAE